MTTSATIFSNSSSSPAITVLSIEAQLALTLRPLGGLTTDEIARAFLVSESTIAQRIVRAKRTSQKSKFAFEIPRGVELTTRLLYPSFALEVRYLHFNEAYSTTAGDDWMRPALCEEALRLGRILAELTPENSEAHGLIALMEIQASRARACVRILLPLNQFCFCDQCRAAEEADWSRIVAFYEHPVPTDPLADRRTNPRVAVSMAEGPQAGLNRVDVLMNELSLAGYHLLPTIRGDLLSKLNRPTEARNEFERAAALTRNTRERELLLERARSCSI